MIHGNRRREDEAVSRLKLTALLALAGAVLGVLLSARWKGIGGFLRDHWPYAGLVLGAVLGAALPWLWEQRRRLPFTASISSIKLELPVIGKVEIAMTVAERNLLWRFFLELATRVATQPLREREGSLREALSSLYSLFSLARTELVALPPIAAPPPGKISAQAYVLKVLNDELRPLLTRWHPRLAAWERTQMPEAGWPLAQLCCRDMEVTRARVVSLAWELGEALGFAELRGILPAKPTDTGALTPLAELHDAEARLLRSLDAERAKAGWHIFVEAASRISTQPLAPETGLLREALQSLYSLFGAVRKELQSMPPTPPLAGGGDTVELVAFRLLNRHLRPFLAQWHPRLLVWEGSKRPEADWPEAAACRAELERTRALLVKDVRRLGAVIGVERVDELLPP